MQYSRVVFLDLLELLFGELGETYAAAMVVAQRQSTVCKLVYDFITEVRTKIEKLQHETNFTQVENRADFVCGTFLVHDSTICFPNIEDLGMLTDSKGFNQNIRY